jgi:hypothetical protein
MILHLCPARVKVANHTPQRALGAIIFRSSRWPHLDAVLAHGNEHPVGERPTIYPLTIPILFCGAGEKRTGQQSCLVAGLVKSGFLSVLIHPWLKNSFDVKLKLSFPTCPNADT